MNLKIPSIRKPLIDNHLRDELYDYLRFRHIFRHVYGFGLEWDKMSQLVEKIDKIYKEFNSQINDFLSFLNKIDEKM